MSYMLTFIRFHCSYEVVFYIFIVVIEGQVFQGHRFLPEGVFFFLLVKSQMHNNMSCAHQLIVKKL